MMQKIKTFCQYTIFVAALLIVEVAMFFVANLTVWIQKLFHPYTHFGELWMSFGHHMAWALVGLFITYIILDTRRKKK